VVEGQGFWSFELRSVGPWCGWASGSGVRGWFRHVQSRFVGKPAML